MFNGSYATSSLNGVAGKSIRNLEEVWADLCLPGQNPEPPTLWAESVGHAATELFDSYGDAKSLLDRYARIPRQWDNWQRPEMKKST
jgi:hypothetical protein